MAIGLNHVLIGDESLLVQCAEILREREHNVAAIVTQNQNIADYARQNGIVVLDWDEQLETRLGNIGFDWLFSIANLRIIPEKLLELARSGAINFHDGPLPRYAGLNAPAWALIEGQSQHGVTWHGMEKGVDEGVIHAQKLFDISPGETALTLNSKCFEAGMASFAGLIERIEAGALEGRSQDLGQRSYYAKAKRPAAAGTLAWHQSAETLLRLVNGLNFGAGYANPLVTPKLRASDGLYRITDFKIEPMMSGAMPGTVLAISSDGVSVATGDASVIVSGQRLGDDAPLFAALMIGVILPTLTAEDDAALSAQVEQAARHEGTFRKRLVAAQDIDLMDIEPFSEARPADVASVPLALPEAVSSDEKLQALAVLLARLSGQETFSLAYRSAKTAHCNVQFPGYFAGAAPLNVVVRDGQSLGAFVAELQDELDRLRQQGPYLSDLQYRFADITAPRLSVGLLDGEQALVLPDGCAFALAIMPGGDHLLFDRNRIDGATMEVLAIRLGLVAAAFADRSQALAEVAVMSGSEQDQVLQGWNDTALAYEPACMHQLFERQADRTPDAIAIAAGGVELSYRQLEQRANVLANKLVAAGVGPDVLVGLHVTRSVDLLAGALGILKAGGAYVPLDPTFPSDRLALMVDDSAAPIVLAERALAGSLDVQGARMVVIEDLLAGGGSDARPAVAAAPDNLAYVIYTSGSTGRPKGVMLEHRNVANFFAGMDQRIAVPETGQPVWLAVTSLSFDISVLELFWTLARGFKVVIHNSELQANRAVTPAAPMDFGLFYWGNDDGVGSGKYRLLLEGAKFADQNGFTAIWTPERHFHAFGGPYPNAAVTGAAVASITKNLSIRAGSCVLPLHHPARVAEDWAVLDNLSDGRVGLAVASGWMPEDFVLRPENAPPNNKAAMLRDVETLRQLWRGEKVDFAFGERNVGVVTQPRPVQKELPIWVTTAGNPETYRDAARLGANVLTHLLGQSIAELKDKIQIYRDTLVEVGRDPADYKVTLMLHTLLGADRDEVRERAREPMKDYLRSATALIKQYAWAFPAFKKPQGLANPMDIDLQGLAQEELDAILDFAFQRYFDDSGLFGTVDDAASRINEIAAIGVDEVACLIDFGVATDLVLERMDVLAELVARCKPAAATGAETAPASLADQIVDNGVTHLQFTPSMARMFLMGEADRRALAQVKHLFIGGEALPGSLVAELRAATPATIENMYGPTETTIWSSTVAVAASEPGVVPLGRPIANTQLYVLDQHQRPVPPGVPGELYIGGDGVGRGYHNRPDLTEERFLNNPFAGGRMYRTGDLTRFLPDGRLQFLGRTDHQVKVRGYRIELGEIEARISEFPGVAEAVVVAREDRADDTRLVAYLRQSGAVDEALLRAHLGESLPGHMIPAHFVTLQSFPLTPNAKVDRKALPAPEPVRLEAETLDYVQPDNSMERGIAAVFQRILGVERVGLSDSFFALGGHSLLAVQAHRDLKASIAPNMAITDLFRFPTVGALAAHLSDASASSDRLSKVADRAAARRAALGNRPLRAS
ncbi:MupA/Atu3671 family FMN-dependent luciferase-like monooxygenase [Devosia faecipullorum]|uniref:MupA/Atu3671 family FMN-dependent luciferase-like monooxygenase n=1 Tax=Devosia faecipullorum TaxID=2755039 RepID=UPI001E450017|nr:MupA/Atu3671 family FMN-dependent luciferase-like monooxygenase [Devosia faecipullorum]